MAPGVRSATFKPFVPVDASADRSRPLEQPISNSANEVTKMWKRVENHPSDGRSDILICFEEPTYIVGESRGAAGEE